MKVYFDGLGTSVHAGKATKAINVIIIIIIIIAISDSCKSGMAASFLLKCILAECLSILPSAISHFLTRANAQWEIHGFTL